MQKLGRLAPPSCAEGLTLASVHQTCPPWTRNLACIDLPTFLHLHTGPPERSRPAAAIVVFVEAARIAEAAAWNTAGEAAGRTLEEEHIDEQVAALHFHQRPAEGKAILVACLADRARGGSG